MSEVVTLLDQLGALSQPKPGSQAPDECREYPLQNKREVSKQ